MHATYTVSTYTVSSMAYYRSYIIIVVCGPSLGSLGPLFGADLPKSRFSRRIVELKDFLVIKFVPSPFHTYNVLLYSDLIELWPYIYYTKVF